LLGVSQSGQSEDRVAAVSGLTTLDSPAASAQLTRLMRDPDVDVAQAAIGAAASAGPEADQVLAAILDDASASPQLKSSAAGQLRSRGNRLDASTEAKVTQLVGPASESAGYGGGVIID
jgi:hypothetical protein